MAVLIREDGSLRDVFPADRARGFTIEECYALLDCTMVEVVRTRRGQTLVIDEDGKGRRRAPNEAATTLARPLLSPFDMIVGPALLCARHEFQ